MQTKFFSPECFLDVRGSGVFSYNQTSSEYKASFEFLTFNILVRSEEGKKAGNQKATSEGKWHNNPNLPGCIKDGNTVYIKIILYACLKSE